jgi:hypothetical protein
MKNQGCGQVSTKKINRSVEKGHIQQKGKFILNKVGMPNNSKKHGRSHEQFNSIELVRSFGVLECIDLCSTWDNLYMRGIQHMHIYLVAICMLSLEIQPTECIFLCLLSRKRTHKLTYRISRSKRLCTEFDLEKALPFSAVLLKTPVPAAAALVYSCS